jgi:DNA repair exonuclease SbcCD nuclease subunit
MAGDLFDTARVSEKTRRFVGEAIASHPELRFFSVAGNHDESVTPLFPNDEAPANYHAFPFGAWESVALDERVVVSGTSDVGTPGIWNALPHAEPDHFHIVLAHGQVIRGAEAGGDHIPLRALMQQGIDYLALGHEHSFRCETLDARGLWAYAGCPEGRGFDECGEKGCILLDTDAPAAARVTFLPLSRRTLHEIDVSLEGCVSFGDVQSRVEAAVAAIPATDMVKVVLTGALDPELPRDTVHLGKLLGDRFYFARVKDESRLLIRPEDYLGDISLKGEFIRTVLASSLSDEQKARTIACGLRALRGEEVDA